MFEKDIVLDEEAFAAAIKDYDALKTRLEKLRGDIEKMLELLQTGFNTPAGRKFVSSCKTNLFTPLNDQARVLEHISTTLAECKSSYAVVFTKYKELNKAIEDVQNS